MRSVPVWAVFTPATYTSAAGCGTFADRIRHAAGPAGAGPGPSGSTRGQTFTTIRYKINQRTGPGGTPWPCQAPGRIGVCGGGPGTWNSEGANVPLISNHSGGVNALLGDGSVRFLRDSTDLLTLARLATRDDGGVVNLDQ